PAPDIEESPRRELDVLFGLAFCAGGPQPCRELETATVADRRRRRFFDRDDDVAARGRPVLQLLDVDAPEQPELAETAAAFEQVAQSQRRARLQDDFAADDLVRSATVADDDDVVDDRLRAFVDVERQI